MPRPKAYALRGQILIWGSSPAQPAQLATQITDGRITPLRLAQPATCLCWVVLGGAGQFSTIGSLGVCVCVCVCQVPGAKCLSSSGAASCPMSCQLPVMTCSFSSLSLLFRPCEGC